MRRISPVSFSKQARDFADARGDICLLYGENGGLAAHHRMARE